MLINYQYLVSKFGSPKGIIHIGAHLKEEKTSYLYCGTENLLWIEANPTIYNEIKENLLPTEIVLNATISNQNDQNVNFYITNNNQSSSILKLKKHIEYHPNIIETAVITVKTITLDSLLNQYSINSSNYDFMNLDIQGAELLALQGAQETLKNIKYIYTEVNRDELYENCAQISDIDNYLIDFKRVETVWTEANWGDAFYIRKEILS